MTNSEVPTLTLIGGLPAAGKTTTARLLANETGAVVLCPDEWMAALEIDLKDSKQREEINKELVRMAKKYLKMDTDVILELSLWKKSERDKLRNQARKIGARVELLFLNPNTDELNRRLVERNKDPSKAIGVVSPEEIADWSNQIEVPTAEELSLFDT